MRYWIIGIALLIACRLYLAHKEQEQLEDLFI
jgi:hypothetical protein